MFSENWMYCGFICAFPTAKDVGQEVACLM